MVPITFRMVCRLKTPGQPLLLPTLRIYVVFSYTRILFFPLPIKQVGHLEGFKILVVT